MRYIDVYIGMWTNGAGWGWMVRDGWGGVGGEGVWYNCMVVVGL